MKLAVVTETFPPEVNGVARTLVHLIAGLEEAGHEVLVVRPRQRLEGGARDGDERSLLVTGWPIPWYREMQFGAVRPRRLVRLWREARPDLVHVATQGPLGVAASRAARRLGIPWTATYHTRFDLYGEHYRLANLQGMIRSYLRWFHNRAARTFVPTRRLAEELTAHGFERVTPARRGVDTELFAPRRRSAALRERWRAGEGTPVVLHVGRLAPEKNVELAIEAFRRIERYRPDARMVVVGDGPRAAALGRANSDLIFTGVLHGDALAAAYASADLLLFPSLTETYGNVVAEGLASGLPVIAFDEAAAAELIVAGENGMTVPPGDDEAFVRISSSFARLPLVIWRAFGSRARRRMETHGWSAAVEEFSQQLLGVAAGCDLPVAA